MKKIFKSLINIFIRFFVAMLAKINLGRYILDIINKNELDEPYISEMRNDLSHIEESVYINSEKWSLFC